MQVGIDVRCMHTNFSGLGVSSFRDIATLKFNQIFLLDHELSMVVKKFNQIEPAQKIHASRG